MASVSCCCGVGFDWAKAGAESAAKAKALELASHADGVPASRKNMLTREGEREAFESAASAALKGNAGSPNIIALIECVRAAFEKPLAQGLAFEREQFAKLRDDERSKALRYAFFAERKAGRVADLPDDAGTRSISTAAVIGAGAELPRAQRPDQWAGQPGTRAPHLWLNRDGERISTLDLFQREILEEVLQRKAKFAVIFAAGFSDYATSSRREDD